MNNTAPQVIQAEENAVSAETLMALYDVRAEYRRTNEPFNPIRGIDHIVVIQP